MDHYGGFIPHFVAYSVVISNIIPELSLLLVPFAGYIGSTASGYQGLRIETTLGDVGHIHTFYAQVYLKMWYTFVYPENVKYDFNEKMMMNLYNQFELDHIFTIHYIIEPQNIP